MSKNLNFTCAAVLAFFCILFFYSCPTDGDETPSSLFTVTFDKNNSDTDSVNTEPGQKTASPGASIDAMPADPVRYEYVFKEWNIRRNGSGSQFTLYTPIYYNITVYAQWELIKGFVVTFDKNNNDSGSSSSNPLSIQVVPPASIVPALPVEPARPGHVFTGWNSKSDGTGSLFTASVAVNNNIKVYAQWEEKTGCVVTFNKNTSDSGSAGAYPGQKQVPPGVALANAVPPGLPYPPVRHGYNFIGWNSAVNGTGLPFTETVPVSANITVYAQWTPVEYIVTFDKNAVDAGEANPSDKIVRYPAGTIDVLPAAPVRTGYWLESWNTESDGSGIRFSAAVNVTGNITVYAQWVKGYLLANENFEGFTVLHSFTAGAKIPAFQSEFSCDMPSGNTITVINENGNKVLELSSNTANNTTISYNVPSTVMTAVRDSKKAYISYRIKHNGIGVACVPYIYFGNNGSGGLHVSNRFTNNRLDYYNGSSTSNITAPAGVWYELLIIIDYSTSKYSFVFNNGQQLSNLAYRDAAQAGYTNTFGSIRFYENEAAGGKMWIDDIKIWYDN